MSDFLAHVVEDGIAVHRADALPKGLRKSKLLPVVERRPKLAEGEIHVGPTYVLDPKGKKVWAEYDALPAPDATRDLADELRRAVRDRVERGDDLGDIVTDFLGALRKKA